VSRRAPAAWTGGALAYPHAAAERAIRHRHSVYHVIEWNVAAMGASVKGEAPIALPAGKPRLSPVISGVIRSSPRAQR
jgi:hypothetical protein